MWTRLGTFQRYPLRGMARVCGNLPRSVFAAAFSLGVVPTTSLSAAQDDVETFSKGKQVAIAVVHLLHVAPKGGTLTGAFVSKIPLYPLLSAKAFDGARLPWIGRLDEVEACGHPISDQCGCT